MSKAIKDEKLTVVMPVYNEALALPFVLPELIAYCSRMNWRLLLVNDGSRDASSRIIETHICPPQVDVIHHKVNRGYGGALKTGLGHVETPYCVTIDGDGQHNLDDVSAVLGFALEKDADLVVGRRVNPQPSGWYRGLGKWLIRAFTRFLIPLPVQDLNSGFKLYRTELAKRYVHLCPDSMAFSDVITLLFIHQHYRVLEHPISINQRVAGKSTISTYTAFQTVMEIINLVMLVNPLRIFLPLSISCIITGLAWGIPIMLAGRGVSVGSMLAIVLGMLFFFLGLLASQLAAIRIQLSSLGVGKQPDIPSEKPQQFYN